MGDIFVLKCNLTISHWILLSTRMYIRVDGGETYVIVHPWLSLSMLPEFIPGPFTIGNELLVNVNEICLTITEIMFSSNNSSHSSYKTATKQLPTILPWYVFFSGEIFLFWY